MKQIKYFLEKFDGIWSVPLAMFAFWFIGYLMQVVFGLASGAYDMAFFQPLFLAIAVVITAANAAMIGMKFNFKGLHRYLYGVKHDDGEIINESKFDWNSLTAWQKFKFTGFVYFSLFFGVVIVFAVVV